MRARLMAVLATLGTAATMALGSVTASALPSAGVAHAAVTVPETNPIVVENRLRGTSAWRIPWAGHTVADDRTLAIKGYASAASVNQGEALAIRVRAASAGPASYRVYRLGWYQGLGGREMVRGTFNATTQPAGCVTEMPTGLITCPWTDTFTVRTTDDWTSGIYVVVLTRGTVQSYATFVVRDDARTGALVHLQSTLTTQAYNNFPNNGSTGKSLYPYNSFGAITLNGYTSAVKASFDRPYADSGAGFVMTDDAPMIRYAESRGFDVTYATDMDLHAKPDLLVGQEGLISVGHDEYWTGEMFTAAEQARDAGVDLAFFGANDVYWQVRMEPSAAGVPDRIMVAYREADLDPIKDGSRTVLFRDLPRPEQPLIGQMWPTNDYTGMTLGDDPWVVRQADHWFYRGTGLSNGSQIPMLVGIEVDRRLPEFPGPVLKDGTTQAVLAGSTFITRVGGNIGLQESTLFQAPSNAYVFSAGTLRYTRGLLGDGPAAQQTVRTMTTNLLARFDGMQLQADTTRVGGQDRYRTAVELSRQAFPTGPVPVAYVATGAVFPDALAAAGASRGVGPVLLVPGATVPQVVLDELARLRPARLVVVGGSSRVSDVAMEAASAAAGVPAERAWGLDRHETAAALSGMTFGAGVPIAYVATGADFPDALAAGAAAAQLGGPVLLTAGTVLSAAARDELVRLKPQRIVAVGGAAVVADGVLNQLAQLAPQAVRISGADRFETALAVARDLAAPASAHTVGLATALDFADALAAGPAVAAAGGALLLVGGSVTPALAEELVRSDPERVLIAGLAGAVPDGVVTQVQELFAPSSEGTPPPPMRRAVTPNDPDIPDITWQTQESPYPEGAELPWLELPPEEWQHDPGTG